MSIGDLAFDQCDHFLDMAGGTRFHIWRESAKGGHISMET
jgi:hypothetical protein